jgi:hypothetical protein
MAINAAAKRKVTPMSPERWAFSPETYAVTARRDEWSNALARLSIECESTVSDDVAGSLAVRRFSGSFVVVRLAAPPQILLAKDAQISTMRWLVAPLDGDMHLANGGRAATFAPDELAFGDISALTPLVIRTASRLLLAGFSAATLRTRMLDALSPRDARLPANAVGTRILCGLMATLSSTMEDMQE